MASTQQVLRSQSTATVPFQAAQKPKPVGSSLAARVSHDPSSSQIIRIGLLALVCFAAVEALASPQGSTTNPLQRLPFASHPSALENLQYTRKRGEEILKFADDCLVEGDGAFLEERAASLIRTAQLLDEVGYDSSRDQGEQARVRRDTVLSRFAKVCEEVAETKAASGDKVEWLLKGVEPLYRDHMDDSRPVLSAETYRAGANLWRRAADLLLSAEKDAFRDHPLFNQHPEFASLTSSQEAAATCFQQAGHFSGTAANVLEASEESPMAGVPSEAVAEASEEAAESHESAREILKALPKENLSAERQAVRQWDVACAAIDAQRVSPNPERESRALAEAGESIQQFQELAKTGSDPKYVFMAVKMSQKAGQTASDWKEKGRLFHQALDLAETAYKNDPEACMRSPLFAPRPPVGSSYYRMPTLLDDSRHLVGEVDRKSTEII